MKTVEFVTPPHESSDNYEQHFQSNDLHHHILQHNSFTIFLHLSTRTLWLTDTIIPKNVT